LLYWYKSTNTDAGGGGSETLLRLSSRSSLRKPSSRAAALLLSKRCVSETLSSCAPAVRYSLYLLYWYKSTNTDAEGSEDAGRRDVVYECKSTNRPMTCRGLDLLVQKYRY
jgi:hypothetical protein